MRTLVYLEITHQRKLESTNVEKKKQQNLYCTVCNFSKAKAFSAKKIRQGYATMLSSCSVSG